eukprot:Gregarina_sp_Poly_1__4411@NODE_237_length_10947_cov_116_066912_g209_i0_p8_GENE_NODE_237_length_10947_cov_116_066912_g209_i0NODE_237_length_10947_cov_116_066912_g209_i0_p8_ORF_typecomplete_len165_score38_35Nop53/PF07767_11/0_013CAF20/PF17052_5/0_15Pox_A_type_inc/PF04508_12/44Pox_A_type_inc/PF04508_12/0_54_NODE_237_length_10947_cov_116_066912_g209_i032583752
MFAGNSFATRLDILDDSDLESELDVTDIPLTEVATFVGEEIDRVKAEITELKKELSPVATHKASKHNTKQTIRKKQVDPEGWQTIGNSNISKHPHSKDEMNSNLPDSNGPIVRIDSGEDGGADWQEASERDGADKAKAPKKKTTKKRSRKAAQQPPIPGLVYVK